MSTQNERIEQIYRKLHSLSINQIEAIENIVSQLTKPYITIARLPSSDIIDDCLLYMFGDALKIHHCFSKEPLSKDRFEYALERSSQLCGKSAKLAPKGNPGHDITINGTAISLKPRLLQTSKQKGYTSLNLWSWAKVIGILSCCSIDSLDI